MLQILRKLFIAIINVLFLGIGYATTGNLKKAAILQFAAGISFAIGGYCGAFSNFTGFLIIYSFIIIVYLYAFISSFFIKDVKFCKPWKSLLLYFAVVIVIKAVLIVPVRMYYFEPLKFSHAKPQDVTYIMKDKRDNQKNKLLYVFWSTNHSKIGQSYSHPK